MQIKKKGNFFVAYLTHESEFPHPDCKIGDPWGKISIKTGRFSGATGFMAELHEHLEEYLKPKEEKYEQLIDEVIDSLKKDIAIGDLTVLDELLRMIPTRNLIQSLDEGRWKEFDEIERV